MKTFNATFFPSSETSKNQSLDKDARDEIYQLCTHAGDNAHYCKFPEAVAGWYVNSDTKEGKQLIKDVTAIIESVTVEKPATTRVPKTAPKAKAAPKKAAQKPTADKNDVLMRYFELVNKKGKSEDEQIEMKACQELIASL